MNNSMRPSGTAHIFLDDRGRAWIDDTNVKVIEVVLDWKAYGWGPEEIRREHDNYFSLAQIHAAFCYYFDHQAEFDAEIERQCQEVDKLRAESLNSPVRQKLRALGKLS
jgi:uncharacterized protein (DUF433 family)